MKINKKFALSIIVPSFNNAKNLDATIRSIDKSIESFYKENNFYPQIEVIIADNSTSEEVANMVKDLNLEYITHIRVRPLGLSYVRNKAIKLAKYNYVALIDSDCTVKKNWLIRIYHSILKNRSPDVIQGAYFMPFNRDWFSLSESEWDKIRFYKQKQADGKNLVFKKKAYFKIEGYNLKHFYSSGAESLILMDRFKQHKLKITFDDSVIVYHKYPSLIGELKRYNKFGKASIHIKYERPDLFKKEFSPLALWKNLFTLRFGKINFFEYIYQVAKLTSFTIGYFIGKRHYLKEIKKNKIISPHLNNY